MMILKDGCYVVKEEECMEVAFSYEERVVSLIRQKYSLDEELAIQRQRDTKPDEFQLYFEYCEACKKQAATEA